MKILRHISSKLLASITLSAALIACGSGGGSTTTPVAAGMVQASAGSPISSAKVLFTSLADSTSYTSTADSKGNISIPQAGVSYPAIVSATSLDGSLTYYGYIASSTQQTAPVNPITSLILALASGLRWHNKLMR